MARWMITILLLFLAGLLGPPPAAGQQELSSGSFRYGDREVSTGYYEEYEVRPGREQPFMQWNKVHRMNKLYDRNVFVPGSGLDRRFMADAHANLPYYTVRNCADCHRQQALNNLHVLRAGISCRQCHQGEPIAMVSHYYSPLNPIRRHAYVCAKCHQGAGASFATYVVHEPSPAAQATAMEFPWLYWAFWIMVGITLLTFVVFLPHTLLWVFRELVPKGKGGP